MIQLKGVNKIYKSKKGPDTIALQNINLTLENKGLIFIIGKSGSGKSTLLNLLGSLDQPTSGTIIVGNKDITKMKPVLRDSYRNSYVGFIFQEFHILEEYNVYENIELALELQRKKYNRSDVDRLLEQLGIPKLGNRKINELSGGQKQRVAIARAIVKDPQLILADEPTGNLDDASSKQIFEILKKIGEEKLVIVISHDKEAAEKYGDRIIELKDGVIISDTLEKAFEKEESMAPFKPSKLPNRYALKMAFTSMKRKPLKLFFTIILTTLSLIFMGLTLNTTIYNQALLQANVMKDNNEYVYQLTKTKIAQMGSIQNLLFPVKEQQKIENNIGRKLNFAFNLYDNGKSLSFEYTKRDEKDDYFTIEPSYLNYVELKDDNLANNVIGSKPTKENELVIHKYLAEYMMKYGVKDSSGTFYYPSSIEALVKESHPLLLGENVVTIVGVIDDDLSFYKKAKEKGTDKSDSFRMYFSSQYIEKGSVVYTKGFVDKAILNYDTNSILSNLYFSRNNDLFYGDINVLSNQTSIITKNGVVDKLSLQENEVVIKEEDLKELVLDYDNKFKTYLENHKTESYEIARQNFLIELLNKYQQPLEVEVKSMKPLLLEKLIKANVVGISLDQNRYVSEDLVSKYQPNLKLVYSAYVYDKDINRLQKTFEKYPLLDENTMNGVYMISHTPHQEDVKWLIRLFQFLHVFLIIVSLVFVIFTIILFTNFISVSISYCKKEIGILRAIGTKGRDVVKIFAYESLIVSILSYLFSIVGWYFIVNLLNSYFFGDYFYTFRGIIHHPIIVVGMFLFTILLTISITVLSVSKVIRIKPIDAILNK